MINISKLLCGLSICLLLTSCESPRKQQAKEPVVIKVARNEREPNYTVQEGDTVGSVAQQYDMTRAELIALKLKEAEAKAGTEINSTIFS